MNFNVWNVVNVYQRKWQSLLNFGEYAKRLKKVQAMKIAPDCLGQWRVSFPNKILYKALYHLAHVIFCYILSNYLTLLQLVILLPTIILFYCNDPDLLSKAES